MSTVGALTPQEAWALLERDPRAVLVDVRTTAEWAYVGAPDLSSLGRQAIRLDWQQFPTMALNAGFVAALSAAVPDPTTPIAYLCRSGVRSLAAAEAMAAAGYTGGYNITGGFEGVPDAQKHRGTVDGWKVAGLPWVQG